MKNYSSPTLTDYGSIVELTGIFGDAFTGDVLIDQNGDVVQTGDLSIDACASEDLEVCTINP